MYKPQGMSHTEGGWPKEVDATEKEQTQRYKKKIEKDDVFLETTLNLADNLIPDHAVRVLADALRRSASLRSQLARLDLRDNGGEGGIDGEAARRTLCEAAQRPVETADDWLLL